MFLSIDFFCLFNKGNKVKGLISSLISASNQGNPSINFVSSSWSWERGCRKIILLFLSTIFSIKYKSSPFPEFAKKLYALIISAGEKLEDPSARDRSGANLDFGNPKFSRKV